MISFKNFNEILKSLEVGYTRVQSFWFPQYWTRQLDSVKAESHRKLLRLIEHDVEEAFTTGDTDRARKLWDLFTRSMSIIEFYPETKEEDLEHLKALFNDYTETYYPEEKGVI